MEGHGTANASSRRLRGRPPHGCVWIDGYYVNMASSDPQCVADTHERFVRRRRLYDRERYWDPMKSIRKQRLARSARKRGRPPKTIQLKLDELASTELCVAKQCVHIPEEEIGPDVKSLRYPEL